MKIKNYFIFFYCKLSLKITSLYKLFFMYGFILYLFIVMNSNKSISIMVYSSIFGFKFDLGDYNFWEEVEDLKLVFGWFKAWLFISLSFWFVWILSFFLSKFIINFCIQLFLYAFSSLLLNFFNNLILFSLFLFLLFIFHSSNKYKKPFIFFLKSHKARWGMSRIREVYYFKHRFFRISLIFSNLQKMFFNKNKFLYFFFINIILIIIFVVHYAIFFFSNIYNFNIILFYKKLYFINNNLDFVINLDYISFYFIILTFFIFLIIYFTFFNLKFKNDVNKKKFSIVIFFFIVIEFLLFLTFSTSNIFFFFFFFECSLIPMYILLIILGKGTKKKYYAGFALVFYTLLGSIFLLLGILYLINICNTSDFKNLNFELLDFDTQFFLFFLFFLGFSVKVPIFPFYSWLPEAHVEASTAISILLASIFLKVATYGFIKIIIFNFFIITHYYYSVVFYFSLISIFLASFLSIIQTDLKKIIALSSIIHMNYMVIAIFSLEPKAVFASFIYMFSHAFVSSGMFYLIGILYENSGTRDLLNYGNISKYDSKFFIFFIFFNLSNISFPLTISFVSEIMIINNLIFLNIFILILILLSIIISVIYTFWIIHNVMFGKFFLKKNSFFLNKFDLYFLIILMLIIIILGITPFAVTFNLEQEIYLLLLNKLNIY